MGDLVEQMRMDMVIREYSLKTIETCLWHLNVFLYTEQPSPITAFLILKTAKVVLNGMIIGTAKTR